MKLVRITVHADHVDCGVTFETGPGRFGRAIVTLSDDVRASVLAAAQAAFDAAAAEVKEDVQSAKLTAELHRLRNARQEHDAHVAHHTRTLEEHARTLEEAGRLLAATKAEHEKALEALAAVEARRAAATMPAPPATEGP